MMVRAGLSKAESISRCSGLRSWVSWVFWGGFRLFRNSSYSAGFMARIRLTRAAGGSARTVFASRSGYVDRLGSTGAGCAAAGFGFGAGAAVVGAAACMVVGAGAGLEAAGAISG